MIDECAAVRESTTRVVAQASHVSIDDGAVEQLAQELLDDPASREQQEWDADVHYEMAVVRQTRASQNSCRAQGEKQPGKEGCATRLPRLARGICNVVANIIFQH